MAAPPPSPLFPALFRSSRTNGWSYAEKPKCVPVELVGARPLVALAGAPALSRRQHSTATLYFPWLRRLSSEAKGAMKSRPGSERIDEGLLEATFWPASAGFTSAAFCNLE